MNKHFRTPALEIQPCKRQICPPLCSGSGVKSFLHSRFALSAALFIAQAETAELTAVMSLALMECFVPPCVHERARAPPVFRAKGKRDAGAKMADS